MTLDEQVEALFPVDGPHSADRSREAARSIAALVRYLNHATYHAEATPGPADVDSLVRSLRGATVGLEQLLRQVGQQLDGQVARFGDRMYSDDGRDAAEVVAGLQSNLNNARDYLGEAAGQLQHAARYSSHLGVREEQ